VAAFEIMATNLRVKDAILNGESEGKTFNDIIVAGKPQGMISFDEFIIRLYEEGKIDENTAMAYASRKDIVGRGLDRIKSARGISTSGIQSLEIDRGYGGEEDSLL
jgi:twitching motility protein PilT